MDHSERPPAPEQTPSTPKRTSTTSQNATQDSPRITHDSLVTVRLSEPPALTVDTSLCSKPVPDILVVTGNDMARASSFREAEPASDRTTGRTPSTATLLLPDQTTRSLQDELVYSQNDEDEDEEDQEVNWEELEKTEDEQAREDEADNSTALLLARLEQENAKLATNPKSIKVQPVDKPNMNKPRPPSMAQLRQMMNGPTPPALRYSMLPPPPMTDLEFYSALVKDYQQTAARLPTLLSNKIRKGIPPPLRGVVWQSMSGARDAVLEEQYERFGGESSPYEFIIGKDLGRSFPGVDMFREPEGDGQRMLGRVLKAFSLYDTKIGYCQGLAFLVGPLLMHMPDKQAFCVLVRLMERYDLRACFLPDLSGLHARIYQFRELLRTFLPALSAHLEELQVDPAYVSQWFLSFFAVTCPLPMLFRIYDVLFAEGASETLMRVALSLMQKNEARLLACGELEDVMQLLLSRGLWDCYHYNADEFVHDFVGLSGVVTREKLSQLEQGYRESLVATVNAPRASAITTAATRFLGRIWATSTVMSPRALGPGLTAPSRPLSMLRRSPSKQSLASTLNSMEASSASVTSSTSTEATSVSRDSTNADESTSTRESTPVPSKLTVNTKATDDRYLHSQIEDLLTALSELQRDHALLTSQLQREQEEREEDRKAVQSLLAGLKKRNDAVKLPPIDKAGASSNEESTPSTDDNDVDDLSASQANTSEASETSEVPSAEELSELLQLVENRFDTEQQERRPSIMMHSKQQLRDELVQAKDQLAGAKSQTQDLSRQVHDLNQEMTILKEQLRESHGHVRLLHQDRQKLERQMHTMRGRSSSSSTTDASNRELDSEWPGRSGNTGLREFKLGRSRSTPSKAGGLGRRVSSLSRETSMTTISTPPTTNEDEDLLLQLAQAKTAEAMAKQEAEEVKQKLEALRKLMNAAAPDTGAAIPNTLAKIGRAATTQAVGIVNEASKSLSPAATAASTGGGFWGWRR